MGFSKKLQYFIVKNMGISNKEAQDILYGGRVRYNHNITLQNIDIEEDSEIFIDDICIKKAVNFKYLAFNKPLGIETTFNEKIPKNLKKILPFHDVFPIGRLDKASQGLMILSNDGSIYDKILRKEHEIEKVYIVKVDKVINEDFLNQMSNGIKIMGRMTLACKLVQINKFTFEITLIQGLNRQIRRMCYKLGYEVISLLRIKVGKAELGDLKPGEWREISKNDLIF